MSSWFQTYGFADILGDLLVGAYPLDNRDVTMLARLGVRRILNLVEDSEYRSGEREEVERALAGAGIEEHRLNFTDFAGLPPEELDAAVQTVNAWLDEGARSYVHCRAGWQRSAAVAAAVIALREQVDIDEALRFVQRRKPSADPLPHQREDLRRWWETRAGGERGEAAKAEVMAERATPPAQSATEVSVEGASPPAESATEVSVEGASPPAESAAEASVESATRPADPARGEPGG